MAIPPQVSPWQNWGNSGDSVLQLDSTGDQQIAAQLRMPGTGYGAVPIAYTTAAQLVYPTYDGSVGKTLPGPLPTDYAAPTERFLQWHSAHQLQKLKESTTSISGTVGGTAFDLKTLSLTVGGQTLEFMLSQDGQRVINLTTLQKADIAKLTLAEQKALTQSTGWSTLKDTLGLDTASTTLLNQLIGTPSNASAGSPRKLIVDTFAGRASWNSMTQADVDLFLDQLAVMQRRFEGSAIIDQNTIQLETAKIVERFQRAFDFAQTEPQQTIDYYRLFEKKDDRDATPGVGTTGNAADVQTGPVGDGFYTAKTISSDDNATIKRGYEEFLRAERQILAALETREAVANSVLFRDPKLDVPNLIFRLQQLYEFEAAGRQDAGTEEMKQLHKLLTDYGIMQRLVNETIGYYNAKESDEKRRFLNIGAEGDDPDDVDDDQTQGKADSYVVRRYEDSETGVNLSGTGDYAREDIQTNDDIPKYEWGQQLYNLLSQSERRAISMFMDESYMRSTNLHPMEVRAGVEERPKIDLVDDSNSGDGSLFLHRKGKWDSFSTQLSDRVTILNQQNQIKQNEIENDKKQENRHFDLANNALRKMNDMLLTIGRI